MLEYLQGMAEVKAYRLSGRKSRELNEAIAKNGAVNAFLKQGLDEKPAYDDTIRQLKEAVS